jgi:hypothetical protein
MRQKAEGNPPPWRILVKRQTAATAAYVRAELDAEAVSTRAREPFPVALARCKRRAGRGGRGGPSRMIGDPPGAG